MKELIRSSIDGQCHGRLRLDESAQLRCNDCWRSCLFADFGSMDEHLIRWAGFGSAPWLRALCIPARQARRPSSVDAMRLANGSAGEYRDAQGNVSTSRRIR